MTPPEHDALDTSMITDTQRVCPQARTGRRRATHALRRAAWSANTRRRRVARDRGDRVGRAGEAHLTYLSSGGGICGGRRLPTAEVPAMTADQRIIVRGGRGLRGAARPGRHGPAGAQPLPGRRGGVRSVPVTFVYVL